MILAEGNLYFWRKTPGISLRVLIQFVSVVVKFDQGFGKRSGQVSNLEFALSKGRRKRDGFKDGTRAHSCILLLREKYQIKIVIIENPLNRFARWVEGAADRDDLVPVTFCNRTFETA